MSKNLISLLNAEKKVIRLYQPYPLLHIYIRNDEDGKEMLISSSDIYRLIKDFADSKNWETEINLRSFLTNPKDK